MPRPQLYPVKKVVGFNQAMLDAIEQWRAKQKPISNVSDAIRRLVELGLKAKAK
jgi:regulatory protein YycI of two-component signal transduction system YycFG